jgi:uncharacterized protein YjdB
MAPDAPSRINTNEHEYGIGEKVMNKSVLIIFMVALFCGACSAEFWHPGEKPIPATGVIITKTTGTYMVVGGIDFFNAIVMPEDATDKRIKWSSNHKDTVEIDEDSGVLRANGVGYAFIRAVSVSSGVADARIVEVLGNGVPLQDISLSKTETTLPVNRMEILNVIYRPENATNQNVTWISDNLAVASVNNGVITTKSEGTATITVTAADGGKTAACKVTVSASAVSVTGVSLNKKSASLPVGATEPLSATITPSNAANKDMLWSSNNPLVATVSQDGVVTAISEGNAVIIVTTAEGGKTATCAITVTRSSSGVPVSGVTLDKGTLSLIVGDTQPLTASVFPSNAANKTVSWNSSNPSVALVSGSGASATVTAISTGNADITVTTEDGGKTAACAVTVNPATIAISFSSLSANGSSSQTTTQLALAFSEAIPGLTASDISLSGVSGVTKGTLSGSGPSYTLSISGFSAGGKLTVSVSKAGYDISPSSRQADIYYYSPPIVDIVYPSNLESYLASKAPNTPAAAYNINLIVGSAGEFNTVARALMAATPYRYVHLDLSGSSITAIPSDAFYNGDPDKGCETLVGVTIPNGVTRIEDTAFFYCSGLASITIPNGVTSIGIAAFGRCYNLSSASIPGSVSSIGQEVFSKCRKLTSISVASGNSAFSAENAVLYNKNKTTIIAYPSATGSISIPNSVTSIGEFALAECIGLTSVSFPSALRIIDLGAFLYCTGLASITIPAGVTTLEYYAFYGCPSLVSVTFQGSIPSSGFEFNVFDGDLRDKYLAGGPGIYTRATDGETWLKH